MLPGNKKSLGIILDEEVYTLIKQRCLDERIPMSQEIRELINAGLEKTDLEVIKGKLDRVAHTQDKILSLLAQK